MRCRGIRIRGVTRVRIQRNGTGQLHRFYLSRPYSWFTSGVFWLGQPCLPCNFQGTGPFLKAPAEKAMGSVPKVSFGRGSIRSSLRQGCMAAIHVLFHRERATLASIRRGGTTKWQDHQLAEANGPEADISHCGLSDCQRPDHLTGTVCFAGFPGGTVTTLAETLLVLICRPIRCDCA